MTATERARVQLGPAWVRRYDVTSLLTVWLVLLLGISALQVVPGIGAIGSPAMLLALLTPFLWAAGWVLPESGLRTDRHPLRAVLLLYLGTMLLSYAVAMSRPVTVLETTGALRALLITVALVGIALLVADGVADQERLNVLLRRLVVGGSFIGLIGILQFLTGMSLLLEVPGLAWNHEVAGVGARSIFNRPASTTMHPIEFSVVTASLVPLGVHFSLYGDTTRQRRNMATATTIIAASVPVAVSRSGILSLVVGLSVLALGWGWRRRFNGLVIGAMAVPLVWAVVPGLVGTFVSLFAGTAYDPSIQARIERGPLVMAQVRQRPWLGLGNGTFSVEEYFLLDNQVWVTLLETGLIGLAVVALLILAGIAAGIITARMPDVDPSTAHLSNAVAASIAALSISVVTFDAFFYRILTGMLFLLIGATGAMWRMHRVSERLFDRSGLGTGAGRSRLRSPPPRPSD